MPDFEDFSPEDFVGSEILLKFAKRIGISGLKRTQWLCEFAEMKFDEMTKGQLLSAVEEFCVWIIYPYYKNDYRLDPNYAELSFRSEFSNSLTGNEDEIEAQRSDYFLNIFIETQAALKDGLGNFMEKGTCKFKIGNVTPILFHNERGEVCKEIGGSYKDQFLLRAVDLLQEYGGKIRKCDDSSCESIFVASKRQLFCSPRCSSRTRASRYRKKNPEKIKHTQHELYARKQKEKIGQNVKVGTRNK